MGENEHQSREWSIDIDHQNNLEEGPLHYGRKELMGMQRQKTRYWSEFGERVNAQELVELQTYIKNQEQYIRGHYSMTSKLQSSEYIAMILLDAVFIIELFVKIDRGATDFLINTAQHMSSIKMDLLLLENQIPYYILNHLYSSVFPNSRGYHSFFDLCLNFFVGMPMFNWSLPEQPQLKHLTDFMRFGVVGQVQPTVRLCGDIIDLPCATKLKKSGLKFKGIDQERCLHKISLVKKKHGKWLPWFGVYELQIPRIKISDEVETIFRNLMALEIFHYQTQTYICYYADLMDHLIDTNKDVDLLVEKGIIVNWVGDIEVIARMFNRLNLYIAIGKSPYFEDAEKMKAHYKYPWNHLMATLKSVYFSNLWTSTATVAAASLLVLTAIQTVYSMKQER